MSNKVVKSDAFKTKNHFLNTDQSQQGYPDCFGDDPTETINQLDDADSSDQQTQSHDHNEPELEAFFNELRDLLSACSLSFLVREMQKIYLTYKRANFQVSVVGEFLRGKSTIVNRILNQEVLPTCDTPTASMITKIVYNAEPRIVFYGVDGISKTYPMNSKGWDSIHNNQEDNDNRGTICVGLNNSWLHKYDIELVDTPGAEDLSDDRICFLNDAILSSDGVLVAVSALAPLSLTEMAFIEQRLIIKKIPYLALVLTRLDQVPNHEKGNVIKYVTDKVSIFNRTIPIFVSKDDLSISGIENYDNNGINGIRQEIETWVTDSNHCVLKRNSISFDLLDIINMASSHIRLQIDLSSQGIEEQNKEKAKHELAHKRINLKLESIQTEILSRCNACIAWLSDAIKERQELIIERFQNELSESENPFQWCKKDYPFGFKTEMLNLSASLDSDLNSIFERDMAWLTDTMASEFNIPIGGNKETLIDKNIFKKATPQNNDIKLDFGIFKAGVDFVKIIVYQLLPQWGKAASMIGEFIAEGILDKKINEQQKQISIVLDKEIPSLIDQAIENIEKKLSIAYQSAFKQVQESFNIWLMIQKDAFTKTLETKDKTQIELLAQQYKNLNSLSEKIKNIMEENNVKL